MKAGGERGSTQAHQRRREPLLRPEPGLHTAAQNVAGSLLHDSHPGEDQVAWDVFQDVRGAWERLPAATRDALRPAMRSALALRLISVRRAEAALVGAEMRRRAQESMSQASSALAKLDEELESEEGGGVLGILDALHICEYTTPARAAPPPCAAPSLLLARRADTPRRLLLHAVLSTLPLHAACSSCAELCSWIQELVRIRPITHATVAEAERAINSVTMSDRLGASSPLRRALAVALVAALCRRLNARGPNCWRQLSIISKNLAGALQASRAATCAGRAPAAGLAGGGTRNPIHLPTTTSAPATRASKSVLGAGLVRAMEAGGEEEEEQARADLCRMVCVSGIAQVLVHWAPILSQQLQVSGDGGRGSGGSSYVAGGDHVTLESAFLVTGLRVLLEEVADVPGAPAHSPPPGPPPPRPPAPLCGQSHT